MSVTEVASRIGQIQAQLASLAPRVGSGTAFATAMRTATPVGSTLPGSATAGIPDASSAPLTGTGDLGEQAVAEARKYLGMPYVWGGADPSAGGMDCSGLVQHVYGTLGVDLPRVSRDQARAGEPVASLADARPGDLLAWDNSSRNTGADHIAIYIGGGKMIEAPRTGLDIRIADVPSDPDYIRRVVPSSTAATSATSATGAGPLSSTRHLDPDVPFRALFEEAGRRYGVDPALVSSVARQESGYNPLATSHAGAQGLMQLMPGTAAGLGVSDPFDPAQAVDGGARMLRQLLDRFDGRVDLALAAYNAGPAAVDKYGGIPPYPETRTYVASVLAMVAAA